MSVDMFLEFDSSASIKGESIDKKYKDMLQIDSFDFGAEQTSKNRYTPYAGTSSKGVGGSAGVVGTCKTCKSRVARQGAIYCQGCACASPMRSRLARSWHRLTLRPACVAQTRKVCPRYETVRWR